MSTTTTSWFAYNSISGTWDSADHWADFENPDYAIERSNLKMVPRVYFEAVQAPSSTSDEDMDDLIAAPTVKLRDWTEEKTYYHIPYRDTASIQNMVAAVRSIGWMVHHEVEYSDGYDEPTRDDWYIAHPDWVENYHRNGGTWGYSD